MSRAATAFMLAAALAVTPGAARAAVNISPSAALCAADARWVAATPGVLAQEMRQAFREFDGRFRSFAQNLSASAGKTEQMPDKKELAALRSETAGLYRALAKLLPLREAGNDAWPMKFLEENIPGGVPLPDFDPPDREEVLRAAFVRELADRAREQDGRSPLRFLARLEMSRALLHSDAPSVTDIGALHMLAAGALASAYETDFRYPAQQILEEGDGKPLAARLRQQVQSMCKEASR